MANKKLYYATNKALALIGIVFNIVTHEYLMETNVVWNIIKLFTKYDIIILPYNLDCYVWMCVYECKCKLCIQWKLVM